MMAVDTFKECGGSYPDRISLCSRMPRLFLAIVWNYVTLWSHILVLVVDIAVYDMIP